MAGLPWSQAEKPRRAPLPAGVVGDPINRLVDSPLIRDAIWIRFDGDCSAIRGGNLLPLQIGAEIRYKTIGSDSIGFTFVLKTLRNRLAPDC